MLSADAWTVIKVKQDENSDYYFKLLRGSYGGYLGADTWDLNSGITSYTVKDDCIEFTGFSGSVYLVHKNHEHTTMLMQSVINLVNELIKEQGTIAEFFAIDFEQFQKEFDSSSVLFDKR